MTATNDTMRAALMNCTRRKPGGGDQKRRATLEPPTERNQ